MAPASGPVSGAGTADISQHYGPGPGVIPVHLGSCPMAVVVTLDDGPVDPDVPLLHADDLAAVRGDGVFETLLVRDGRPCLVEAHLQRLTQSAKLLELPAPDLTAWRKAIDAAAREWIAQGHAEGALRLGYTPGPGGGS